MFRPCWRLACLSALITCAFAQEVIPLSPANGPDTEKQYFSKFWNTEVVSNVTHPSLTLYRPIAGGDGTSVIICPGGGFMALSIESEGTAVAKWLADRGITAFVLKYRLAHTDGDATQEFITRIADRKGFAKYIAATPPLSIADGLAAVTYVRAHAKDLGIAPDRVGIMGFSAGGTVTAGVALHYQAESRPAFVAPVYPAVSELKNDPLPADAPPLFAVAATDDGLDLAPDSVALYEKWTAAHKSAELHMYAVGGHGFGMRKQGLPSDAWINRFTDWLAQNGLMRR